MGLGVSASLENYFESWEALNEYNKRRRNTKTYQFKRFHMKIENKKYTYKEEKKEKKLENQSNDGQIGKKEVFVTYVVLLY